MYLPKVRFSYVLLSWVLVSSGLLITLLNAPRMAIGTGGIQSASFSARVTATVRENFYTNPVLIHPDNNSVTNNPFEIFSWNEATSSGGIDYYFFYYDGKVVFDRIPNNIPSYSSESYHITHNGNIFTLQFLSPPSEGYHTWQVDGVTRSGKVLPSETWTYLLDTTNPIIILTRVDKKDLYWASNDPQSIPLIDSRNFVINQNEVLLKGKYEANSNLKLTLVCPSNTTECSNMSIVLNNSTGNWEHIFRDLKPNLTYTAYLSAVDSAGNLTTFPSFTITYKPFNPIQIIVTIIQHARPPQPTPTPIQQPEVTPTPTTELTPLPPLSPTPPPVVTPTTITPSEPSKLASKLSLLWIWGLVLHLVMLSFGVGVGISQIWKFIYRVFWPWIKGETEATQWSTFTYYDANSPTKPLQIDFATVCGKLRYTRALANNIYLKVTRPGWLESKLLVDVNHLPQKVILLHDDQPEIWTQFKIASLHLRLLPLLVAIISSAVALTVSHEWPYGVYLYLSLHFGFAEYLYPRLKS